MPLHRHVPLSMTRSFSYGFMYIVLHYDAHGYYVRWGGIHTKHTSSFCLFAMVHCITALNRCHIWSYSSNHRAHNARNRSTAVSAIGKHVYGCVLFCMSHTPTQVALKRILWSYAIQSRYAEASSAAASTAAAATLVHGSYANTPEWCAHGLLYVVQVYLLVS